MMELLQESLRACLSSDRPLPLSQRLWWVSAPAAREWCCYPTPYHINYDSVVTPTTSRRHFIAQRWHCRVLKCTADALAAMHRHVPNALLHRDVKADNVLLWVGIHDGGPLINARERSYKEEIRNELIIVCANRAPFTNTNTNPGASR